jgi:hypothetical protein
VQDYQILTVIVVIVVRVVGTAAAAVRESGSGVESVFEKSAGNSEALSSQEGSIGRLGGFTDTTLVRWFDSRGGSLEKTRNRVLLLGSRAEIPWAGSCARCE